jgi:uncharacterized protein YPO0396
MTSKTLTKIKLINWMYFENVTIEIDGNTLITGTNASGKSTIIDALQYLLVGGRQKSKFNTAADESGKRTLEGYVRATVNTDEKMHLRPGDVTSHIAIEITENGMSDIFGVVIDIAKGNLKDSFYFVKKTSMDDQLFIDIREDGSFIRSQQQFRQHLRESGREFEIFANTTLYRMKQQAYFGVIAEKYAALLPKAIGFKSISKVDSFVNDFLLDDSKIDIKGLKDNMNNLEQLRHLIEIEQLKLQELQDIEIHARHYRSHEEWIRINHLAEIQVNIMKTEHEQNRLAMLIDETDREIRNTEEDIADAEHNIRRITSTIDAIRDDLKGNETFRTREIYAGKLKDLLEQQKTNESHFSKLKVILRNERDIIRTVRNEDDTRFSDITSHLSQPGFDSVNLRKHLAGYHEEIKSLVEEHTRSLNALDTSIKTLEHDISESIAKIRNLKQGIKPYPVEVSAMRNVITRRLAEIHGKPIDAKPLCELADVTDETWRNAVEGYLAGHRFSLFVQPQYVPDALEIFHEEYRNTKTSGVGIVDTRKCLDEVVTDPASLSSVVECKTHHVAGFLYGMLNHVVMADSVSVIQNHPVAMTSSCVVHEDKVVRTIDKTIYQAPFIGRASDEIQIDILTREMDRLKNHLDEQKTDRRKSETILGALRSSRVHMLLNSDVPYLGSIDKKVRLHKEVEETNTRIKTFDQDADLIELTMRYELESNALEQETQRKSQLDRKVGTLIDQNKHHHESIIETENGLNAFRESYLRLDPKQTEKDEAKRRVNHFSRSADITFDEILMSIRRSSVQRQNAMKELQTKLVRAMSTYNVKYDFESQADTESIDAYLEEKRIIESENLIRYNDSLEDLQHKTSDIFKQQFIQAIRMKIMNAKEQIDHLNKLLRNKQFGEYKYRIVIQASKESEMKDYHRIIMENPDALEHTLFDDASTNKSRDIVKSMFKKVLNSDNDARAAEVLDYRNYMDIDIEIKTKTKTRYLSQVKHTQSGGESQVPYYIIAAASFQQLMRSGKSHSTPLCIVLFDEAFNNMDSQRVSQMMAYYNELDIQIFLSLTGEKIDSISGHVDTTLIVIRDDERAEINRFTGDDHV